MYWYKVVLKGSQLNQDTLLKTWYFGYTVQADNFSALSINGELQSYFGKEFPHSSLSSLDRDQKHLRDLVCDKLYFTQQSFSLTDEM